MSSRRLLWSLFGGAALPLIFLANTGCHLVFDLERVRHDNALRCACSCEATGTRTLVISAGSDDAEQLGSDMDLTDGDLDLGDDHLVGLRFDNVMLPAGVTITSAKVQFFSSANDGDATDLRIYAETSVSAATFTTTPDDLSGRSVTASPVLWSGVPAWSSGTQSLAQQTPELAPLLQELVELPGWSNSSAIVLRIEGAGRRRARSFNGNASRAPLLVVSYDASVSASLPVCASAVVERDDTGRIIRDSLVAECSRVEETVQGLGAHCGYPSPCHCELVDLPDNEDTFQADACAGECTEQLPDAECSNFDPNAFSDCLQQSASVNDCRHFVAATNAPGVGTPVCVASGSPLAFHLFGERSLCEITEGTSQILVDGNAPKDDPKTRGIVEIVGGPCRGGSCNVHPFFDLNMEPITFEVRWASDPTFRDLNAAGRGAEVALFDDGAGVATFPENSVLGTGVGRRGSKALAIDATNASPLDIGLDWAARRCDLVGDLSTTVRDDGLCADNATPCAADLPDCDVAGVPCVFPDDASNMEVFVNVAGNLVNQPPSAEAGDPEQRIECGGPDLTPFLLDGRGSSDPDGNLAAASWRRGSRTGTELAKDVVAGDQLGVGGSQTYVLRVIDSYAQTDEDQTNVIVEDTTEPVIACNAPDTIKPREAPQSYTATAVDTCDADVPAVITGYECYNFTRTGRRVDKSSSCIVSLAGGTFTILDVGGYGDRIRWYVSATDDSGNEAEEPCEIVVRK